LRVGKLAKPEQARHEFAAIFESSNDAIIGRSLDGTIISWEGGAERLYGYSASEAVGRSGDILESDTRRGEVRKLLARVQTGDRVANYETVRVRKDGASVEVSLAISPIRDQGGAVVGASTVVREIGELRRAVEALRRSEESYRLLFERHPNPMWLYDPKTLRFLAVNEAAIEVYGYSREEFLAMTIEKIRPVEDRTVLHEALDNLPSGYSGGEVFQHQKKDGTLIDVTISANAFEFEGRRARLVLSQDVTEQRRLEAQLLQAQKMEAIGSLAGGIAHDFNNLLLVIRGYCAVLSNRPSDEELRESTEQIDIAALRAAELTHQLLAFSSQQMLRPEVTDLNAVVEETLKLLRRTLGEDTIVEWGPDPTIASIFVDSGQLTQAVLNLAINARDAMADRGDTIVIRTSAAHLDETHASIYGDVGPGSYVLLEISDSGSGMDEATLRRAFDPFFTTKEEGTGLGLPMVYGFVKQSGGYIWLYSKPGMGTTFKLYFPITSDPITPSLEPEAIGSLGGSETILLVDDTEMVRLVVTSMLESYGYTVLQAANGHEAIELAEQAQGSIDLLITDVVMPRMNGPELASLLVAAQPDLKVLFTSGYPSDQVRHEIVAKRATFIHKPYLPAELAREVRGVLDRGGRNGAPITTS